MLYIYIDPDEIFLLDLRLYIYIYTWTEKISIHK